MSSSRRDEPEPPDDLDRRLARARERADERAALTKRLVALRGQVHARECELRELETRFAAEADDVHRLETTTWSALFAAFAGNREERLTRERAEAIRARAARDACRASLAGLRADEAALRAECDALAGAEAALADLRRWKEASLAASGTAESRELAEIDVEAAESHATLRELAHAEAAADRALDALREARRALDGACGAGRADMMSGALATGLKYARLAEAQDATHRAQRELERLARDVTEAGRILGAFPDVEVDAFSRFADYAFDGVLTDWMVQTDVVGSRAGVDRTLRDVERLRDGLRARLRTLRGQADQLAERRTRVVEGD